MASRRVVTCANMATLSRLEEALGMDLLLGAPQVERAFGVALVLTAYGFGFRHGIDWDHIAVITDITGSQKTHRRSMLLATLYAFGHGLVVFLLGFGAIVLAERLPQSVDRFMERLVGATLILLGIYVFYALWREGHDFRMRSRWMLVFSGIRSGMRWVRHRGNEIVGVLIAHEHDHPAEEEHELEPHVEMIGTVSSRASLPPASENRHRHRHRHIAPMPDDPFVNYGKATSFVVGMIHGIGAETPSQLLIFITAAGAGSKSIGVLLLLCFLAGLLSSNSLIAIAGTFGFLGAAKRFRLYAAVSLLTAVFSLGIGTLFLLGKSTFLPAFFGG